MNILLGISGSIAAYRATDLTRSLTKKGHQVRVVLTQGAMEFVKPELFRYLGAQAVYLPGDDFTSMQPGVPHVDLGKWADKLVIAPLSANTLATLAQGQAHDFLSSIFLAWRQNRPVLMFPAMNTMMWQHPFTQEHVQKLNRLPFVYVVTPASGLLACGDEGAGKLMEVEAISDLVEILNPLDKLKHRVLITTGPTMAPMDPVRFITNPASGKTGLELAKAYLKAGAEVHLLTGSDSLSLTALAAHPLAHISFVPTTQLMHEKAAALAPTCDTVIAAAAVADFEFDYSAQKVKKEKLLTLQLKPAIDILADLLKRRRHEQKFISFAAETDTREEVFKEKFLRKPVDLMIGNSVDSGLLKGDAPKGFRADDGSYWFITAQSIIGPHSLSKTHLAEKIVRWDLQGEVI